MAKKDLEAARRAVMTGDGKKALDAIRLQVGEMKHEEQDLLRERKQQSSSSYQVAVATGLFAAFLGLGMVGAGILLLRRHLLARMQAAAVLHEQREWFRTTLGSIGDAVIATNANGRVKFLNGVAQSMTGWTDKDGRIWVESEVGRGSRFHFVVRLDMADSEPPEPLPPEPASLHGMRVLVVDDNATNRRILDEVLRSWQMVPATAPSAAAAIKLLLEAQQKNEPYRLVLTDAHMPRMDGFMLAEQMKQDSAMGSTVVMMLTSGDRPDDMQRCEELGISAYLLKPIKQSELLEAIELALGITVAKTDLLAPAAQPKHVRSLNILLAEDSLVNQKLAVALLEGQGHKVRVVNNGREAFAALQTEKFDMVLMDVQMPEMDGLEATEKIRAREQHTGTHIPIIAMTAHALKGDRERCLAVGMDGYIAKPIHAAELFNVIGGLFAAPAELVEPPVPEMAEGEIVNWHEALQAVQGNPQLLKTVVEAELEEIPRLMAAICKAIASSDAAALRLAAHTLKGSLRYFGKTVACEEVLRLEKMGQDGNLSEAGASLAVLEREILRINQVLQEHLQKNPMGNEA